MQGSRAPRTTPPVPEASQDIPCSLRVQREEVSLRAAFLARLSGVSAVSTSVILPSDAQTRTLSENDRRRQINNDCWPWPTLSLNASIS